MITPTTTDSLTAQAQAVAEIALDLAALLPDAPLDHDTAEQVQARLARALEDVNSVAELLAQADPLALLG